MHAYGDIGIIAGDALERSRLNSDLLAVPRLIVATIPRRDPGDHLNRILRDCDPWNIVISND